MDPVAALRPGQRFLVAELLRAGVEVVVLDPRESLYEARLGEHRELFLEIGSSGLSFAAAQLTSHKHEAKAVLARAGLSVPRGERFLAGDSDAVLAYAQTLGFPLVIKPAFGTNGRHVHLELSTLVEVETALAEITRDHGPGELIVIEEQFSGHEYRVLITREGDYAVTRRDPPVLVGDGTHSLRALGEAESRRRTSPRRSCEGAILLDAEAERFLARRGRALDDIPDVGEHVQVRGNSNLSTGATGHDCTDDAHPTVLELALRALHAFPGLPVAGLDVMCRDVHAAQTPESYRILEINPLPGIGMHMAPTTGASRDVARALVELNFPELRATARGRGLRAVAARAAPPPEALDEPEDPPPTVVTTAEEAPMTEGHHPIFETCLGALTESRGAEPFVLEPKGAASVESALRALLPQPSLDHAVITLVQFTTYLRDQARSPTAARTLIELTARLATGPLMARGGAAAAALGQLRTSAEQLAALEGRAPARYEPRADAKPGQTKADPFARFSLGVPSSGEPKKPKRR